MNECICGHTEGTNTDECERCRFVHEVHELKLVVDRCRVAMTDLSVDIGRWTELAAHQRNLLPHNHPACPMQQGIMNSVELRQKVAGLLREIREFETEGSKHA